MLPSNKNFPLSYYGIRLWYVNLVMLMRLIPFVLSSCLRSKKNSAVCIIAHRILLWIYSSRTLITPKQPLNARFNLLFTENIKILQVWFQNRRAKFRRNERSALSQSKPIYSGSNCGGNTSASSSLMSGNSGSTSSSSGIETSSSIGAPSSNSDQSKPIEQPVLPKSIAQIGGKWVFLKMLWWNIRFCDYIHLTDNKNKEVHHKFYHFCLS